MTPSARPIAAVACPQIIDRFQPIAGHLSAFAARAEQLGFASIWTSELTTATVLDPLPLLAYCAATTQRVRLGVAVLLTALRSPLRLAQETATVDRLSGGRLIVGVGLGGNRALYPKHGLQPAGRADRFESGLQLLLQLWRGADRPSANPYWALDGTEHVPPPAQRPHPPLWFGARSKAGLERAVRLGDGFVGSGSESTDIFAEQVRIARRLVKEERYDGDFHIAKRFYFLVDDDHSRARERARQWFGANYGKPELAERVAGLGPAGDCAAGAAAVVEAGANTVIFNPIVDEHDQLERLAAEVLPAVPQHVRPILADGALTHRPPYPMD